MVNVYEEKGMQQGMQQGVVVGQRQGLLCLLQEKFGAVPSDVASRVEAISDTERLTEQRSAFGAELGERPLVLFCRERSEEAYGPDRGGILGHGVSLAAA